MYDQNTIMQWFDKGYAFPHCIGNVKLSRIPVYKAAIDELTRRHPEYTGKFRINDNVVDIHGRPLATASQYKAVWVDEDLGMADLSEFWKIFHDLDR